ncbi:tetratricopeptide repeat protein [Tindallia californiensis]|uniref:Tetratricopeptide repeat-containing protein n=1 Tax=Tindallia californiensis TaxID=159292 RepID=A0A1H3IWC5_9FIRM|nr:tetratricopeptide repeat protein [Tindallia californiensis]SDY31488.1 Tetratricopeptide repeat-containing protein [Tindallia californiensis]
MTYYIFSPNSIEQKKAVQKILDIPKESDLQQQWEEYNTDQKKHKKVMGIKNIEAKTVYRGLPGCWLKVESIHDDLDKKLLHYLCKAVGPERLNGWVFYPVKTLPYKELEKNWIRKYQFRNMPQNQESYRVFFKEIKKLLKDNMLDNAYHGLLLILQLKPGFLKKYHRYTLFEELAIRYDQVDSFQRAEKCLKLQCKILPDSPDPVLNISNFYLFNGKAEKAVDLLKESLKRFPYQQYLMHNYIVALSNIGHYQLAFVELKKVLEKDIGNSFYWKLMADILYEKEDLKSALQCYRKALHGDLEEVPEDIHADIYAGMAACYYETDQYKKAKNYYLKVLKIFPEDHYALMNISQIYFSHLNEPDEALKYIKKVLEKGYENGYLYYQLGLIYMTLEKQEKARWHLYRARRMIPHFQPVHEALHQLRSNEMMKKKPKKR